MKFLIPAFIFCSTFLIIPVASAQQVLNGCVYADNNLNGKKDKNEPGIQYVAVSNGIDVVLTNEKGMYAIETSNDAILFVIKPSNYHFPVNEFNLPEFYYIHKPNGSPPLDYKGVSPTGKPPSSVDFGLIPSERTEQFKILVFGDPQAKTREEVDYFYQGIVKELVQVGSVQFGISLGDLVHDDLTLFLPYKKAIKNIGIPWYNVLGNHDINFDATSDSLSDESYENHFGPVNYAFNHGKVHFIVLDNVMYPDPRDGKGYWGGFSNDQFTFIKNNLKHVPKDHLIVLAFHIPLAEKLYDAFRDEDRVTLFELVKDYPNTLSLSAHTHIQRQDFFSSDKGWMREKKHHEYNVGTTSGDWYSGKFNVQGVPVATMRDGTPKGYAFIRFDGNQYQIDYKASGQDARYQMEIYAPNVIAKGDFTTANITVNFFMGGELDTVFCKIDEGDWLKMTKTNTIDPGYFHRVQEWDYTDALFVGRRPSNPINSSHLWTYPLPSDLNTGNHQITIKVIDMFGRVHVQQKNYRIDEIKHQPAD